MTHLCEKIISTLPSWRKLNGPNQLMSLQQFVYDVQDQLNPLASEDDLRRIAQQLHSTGEVRPGYGRALMAKGPATCNISSQEALLTRQVIRNSCSLLLLLLSVTSAQSLGWVFLGFGSLVQELEMKACMVYKNSKNTSFQSKAKSNSIDQKEIHWPE